MKKNRLYIIFFIVILALDQIIKFLVLRYIESGSTVEIHNLLHLTNINSSGYFIDNSNNNLIIKILIPWGALFLLLISLFTNITYSRSQRLFLWTLLAGVSSNAIDLVIRDNRVTEYIKIVPLSTLPIFNIGDMAVVLSLLFMLISLIIQDRSLNRYE